jgi:hypothetical protein
MRRTGAGRAHRIFAEGQIMRRLWLSVGGLGVLLGSLLAVAGSGAGAEGDLQPVRPGTGTLKGKIVLKSGTDLKTVRADLDKLTAQLDAEMAKSADKGVCLNCNNFQKEQQAWWIGDNKQVGNVFVWIEPEEGQYFEIDTKQLAAAKKKVEMGQPACAFVPHCVTYFPSYRDPKNPKRFKPTGQTFVFLNNAKVPHNVNWQGIGQVGGNQLLPPGRSIEVELKPSSSPVAVACNIHPWMNGWIRVYSHPYSAISLAEPDAKQGKADPNYGTYEIKGVPAGKVRILAWQEKVGYLHKGGKKGEPIELTDGETTRDFEIEFKP